MNTLIVAAAEIVPMSEYRPVTDEHRARYHAILQQAFEPESGRDPSYADGDRDEDPEEWPPDLSDPRGLFVDDELVSVCKLYYLDATVRGEWTEIGGLAGVATPPEHRRQGYSRTTIRDALSEYREAGVDLVALWPSTVQFYRDLGWGISNWHGWTDVPPEQLAGIGGGCSEEGEDDEAEHARFRELDVEDWERLRAVEVERATRHGLSLRRSEDWWRKRTLAGWPSGPAPYVYGYEIDGELRGYAITTVREEGDESILEVGAVAGVDHAAEVALLELFADHDLQVDTVRIRPPLATDLHELVPDPGELVARRATGPMIRLTDVRRGLEAVSWPEEAAGRFVLDVDDPLLDHNDGKFVVEVADGSASVDSAGGDLGSSAVLGVGTLSRLAVGAIGVDRAERLCDLEIRNEAARSTLEMAFQPEAVCLREFF